jgi:hypothetical protein
VLRFDISPGTLRIAFLHFESNLKGSQPDITAEGPFKQVPESQRSGAWSKSSYNGVQEGFRMAGLGFRQEVTGGHRADYPNDSYLVDPASSHMLVSKIKPCMSKYKQIYTVKLRMAH